MGSGAMIYIYIYTLSFIKIGSGIHKLRGGGVAGTQDGGRISLLLFFQIKESRLITERAIEVP
jgi:hypothetical protein